MLLTPEITDSERGWFCDHGIDVHEVPYPIPPNRWRTPVGGTSFSPAVLLRYHLFTPGFKSWDRIVHVDVDAIIGGPVEEILGGGRFVAVPDVGMKLRHNFSDEATFRSVVQHFRFPDSRSFNGGVFSFDPALIDEGLFERLLSTTDRYQRTLLYKDQTVMNVHFAHLWHRASLRMNFRPPKRLFFRLFASIPSQKGLILHFMGPGNPWDPGCRYYHLWLKTKALADQLPSDWSAESVESPDIGRLKPLAIRAAVETVRWWRLCSRLTRRLAKRLLRVGT